MEDKKHIPVTWGTTWRVGLGREEGDRAWPGAFRLPTTFAPPAESPAAIGVTLDPSPKPASSNGVPTRPPGLARDRGVTKALARWT
jgi:hypothetical protein